MTWQQRNPRVVFALAVLVLAVVAALGAPRAAGAQEGGEIPDLTTANCAFVDNSVDGIYFQKIIDACNAGLISGCGGDRFCLKEYVMREDMAIYLEKLLRDVPGSPFVPRTPTVDPFTDVSKTYPFAPWIKQLGPACDGITAGCGNNAYCPYAFVSRWEMAVFLSKVTSVRRGEEVPAYGLARGLSFNCTSTPQEGFPAMVSLFPDVLWNDAGCKYIHYIYGLEITAGCGNGLFCPAAYVGRDQMATFLWLSKGKQTAGVPPNSCP